MEPLPGVATKSTPEETLRLSISISEAWLASSGGWADKFVRFQARSPVCKKPFLAGFCALGSQFQEVHDHIQF